MEPTDWDGVDGESAVIVQAEVGADGLLPRWVWYWEQSTAAHILIRALLRETPQGCRPRRKTDSAIEAIKEAFILESLLSPRCRAVYGPTPEDSTGEFRSRWSEEITSIRRILRGWKDRFPCPAVVERYGYLAAEFGKDAVAFDAALDNLAAAYPGLTSEEAHDIANARLRLGLHSWPDEGIRRHLGPLNEGSLLPGPSEWAYARSRGLARWINSHSDPCQGLSLTIMLSLGGLEDTKDLFEEAVKLGVMASCLAVSAKGGAGDVPCDFKPPDEPLSDNPAPERRPGVEPTKVERQAYRLYTELGWTQERVAKELEKEHKRPFGQAKVSRMLKRVREWMGVPKPRKSPTPRVQSVDPRRLDLSSTAADPRRLCRRCEG
jgi:hypothetical protein